MANERAATPQPRSAAQMRQLAKAIERMQSLATNERLCKCEQCKAIREVLKAWRVK